jgi:hypothetical protein
MRTITDISQSAYRRRRILRAGCRRQFFGQSPWVAVLLRAMHHRHFTVADRRAAKTSSSALHEGDGGQSDKAVVWPPSLFAYPVSFTAPPR